MERVLPTEEIKERLAKLAVGLAADCDRPERGVESLMRANLPNAQMLPFVAFVTHDGKWVGGYSGSKAMYAFLEEIEKAEKTPHLQASRADRKKLAGLIPRAQKAAEKNNWKTVVKAGQTAAGIWGRCPEREQIAALVGEARAWANTQFAEAIKIARTATDLVPARKLLSGVKKHFAKDPEAGEAAAGLKALGKLASILKIEAKGTPRPDLREKYAKPFEDTRWAVIFDKKE
ncbi:MAG: hypothetical protein OER88_12245 [Planctomycetota bacterium]|nr:hypothetical protein [Planctomycetota bacterium]